MHDKEALQMMKRVLAELKDKQAHIDYMSPRVEAYEMLCSVIRMNRSREMGATIRNESIQYLLSDRIAKLEKEIELVDKAQAAHKTPERTIDLDNPDTWPDIDSVWRHYNGNLYVVKDFANVGKSTNQDKHPTMIIYKNYDRFAVDNDQLYSRELIDWERSMTEEK